MMGPLLSEDSLLKDLPIAARLLRFFALKKDVMRLSRLRQLENCENNIQIISLASYRDIGREAVRKYPCFIVCRLE